MNSLRAIRAGDHVREADGDVAGVVIKPGPYPGEWTLRLKDGSEVACLEQNLLLVDQDGH